MGEPHDLDPNGPDMTSEEVAARLRVHERTIRNYCAAGAFPGAFRLQKAWRIPQESLIQYITRDGT